MMGTTSATIMMGTTSATTIATVVGGLVLKVEQKTVAVEVGIALWVRIIAAIEVGQRNHSY